MQGKDLLIVISDSGKLSFLTFCNEMHRFFYFLAQFLMNVRKCFVTSLFDFLG